MVQQPEFDTAESWPVVSSADVHRDSWILALRSDQVTVPSGGEPFRRLVVEHPGAVVVLALDEDNRALCLRQYRHPVRHRLLELPAGVRDADGEPSVETAKRELREEAELEATDWTPLLSTWSSPGYTSERIDYFLARGLTVASRGDFALEHEEAEMETLWVPFAELYDAVLDGRVADGPVVQAVLAARARGLA